MEEYSLDKVLAAIHCLYTSKIPEEIQSADKWLGQYRKSPSPWSVLGSIFESPNLPEYVYIFNAQTLKTKLMFDFEEISKLDTSSFKANLLSLSLKFSTQDKVMRQLAQCIGILAIHLVDSWSGTMLAELSQSFAASTPLFLEVLKCIAEEVKNQSIVVDSEKVNSLQCYLEKQTGQIFKFLENCASSYSKQVLEVFLAWVHFGIDQEVATLLPGSKLLVMTCEALKAPEHFETGCGVLCELIYLTENYEIYAETVKSVVGFLVSIRTEVLRAVHDVTIVEGYVKVFTSLGFVHMEKILMEKSDVVLDVLVELVATKSSEAIYELTQFWRGICKKFKSLQDSERSLVNDFFLALLNRLFPICISHFRLARDELENGIEKETEGIRYNISIIVSYITDILTCEKVLGALKGHLMGIVANGQLSDYERYSQIEAIAGCTASIAELCDKNTLSGELIEIISHLCSQIWPLNQVNLTICSILENSSKELSPSILTPVLDYLVSCLSKGVKGKVIAYALKRTLLLNYQTLSSHTNYLLNIQPICETQPSSSHEAILEGVSTVIWRSPQNQEIFQLCRVYAERLLQSPSEDVLIYNCDKIAIIFKVTVEDKLIEVIPVYNLFKNLWPTLRSLVAEFQKSDNAVEEICRIVKHAIKKLSTAFGEFLEEFLGIIVTQFTQFKHSSYLYMAEQLVKIFGNSNLYHGIMVQVFNTLVQSTLQVLNSVQAMENSPELTEDFFGMVNRNISHLQLQILQSEVFESILILAKAGIGLQNCEAAKCLYGFLEVTLEYCFKEGRHYNPACEQKLLKHYQDILNSLIRTVINVVPGQIYDEIEELMYKILLIDEGPTWLRGILCEVPHDCLTEGEKIRFLNECQDARNIHFWLKKLHKRAKQRALRFR